MHVGLIATAIHLVTHLGKYGTLGEVWAVAMEVLYVSRYQCPLKIVPWSIADSIASVDAPRARRAQICAPCQIANPCSIGERFTIGVGACEASKIRTTSWVSTCYEEAHVLVLPRYPLGEET